MHRKSILVLSRKDIYHPRAGGAEQIMHTYMKGLNDEGYAVTQIAPQFSGSSKSEQIDGITIKRMFLIHTIYFAFWFWYLFIRREQYDLIIDHAGGIPLLSPVYVRKKPIVFFTHHVGTKERAQYFQQRLGIGLIGKVFQWIYNTIVLRLYRIKPTITVSQGTAQELRKLGFQNIHVLPNTTDYPRIEFSVPKKELVLTTVGRVVPNKQFSHALYLLKALHNAGLTYHLHIVGAIQDKNEYVYLENIIKTEQLNGYVTFHGKLGTQELISLWDQSRYGLILSDKEGFGLTTLEANARGVPMIGYSIPGINEVIHDGENGRLLPKNDRNKGAQRIMGTGEEEYTKIVEQTVQFITTYPTWEGNQKEFIELIYFHIKKGLKK